MTILLDCGIETALERIAARNGKKDRIESENHDFHRKVRNGYLTLAEMEPERFLVLDAEKPLEKLSRSSTGGFGWWKWSIEAKPPLPKEPGI